MNSSPTTKNQDPVPRPDLVNSSPRPDGTVIVYNPGTDRHLRLGREAFALLSSLDGSADAPGLAPKTSAALLDGFADHGLLDTCRDPGSPNEAETGDPANQRLQSGLRFTRFSSIEWSIGNPSPVLERLRPLLSFVAGPPLLALQVLVTTVGLLAMVAAAPTMAAAATQTPGRGLGLGALSLIIASMALHEMAHAVVLTRYGGTVRRIGLLLFYLAPAMFCDVSDTWLLAKRRHRLRVATAGVEANLFLASVAAIGLVATHQQSPAASYLLSWAVLGNLALTIINLNPLVRLDGYWILAIAVDDPNLRSGLDRRRSRSTGSPRAAVRFGWAIYALAGRFTGALLFVGALSWYWSLR